MATPNDPTETPALSNADLTKAITSLAEIAEAGQKNRQLTVNEAKYRTPWNPTGGERTKLTVPGFYMCGARCDPTVMSNEEIALINKLRPGRYNNRKWEVLKGQDGSIDIRYPRARVEDRIELKGDAPTLTAMLTKIVSEHETRVARKKAGTYDPDEDE